jgi:hypothetical protein
MPRRADEVWDDGLFWCGSSDQADKPGAGSWQAAGEKNEMAD